MHPMSSLVASLFGLSLLLPDSAFGQDFPGSGGGAIPDGDATGIDVTFQVSGVTEEVRNVRVRIDLTHTWMGDLTATLVSPDGLARLKLFGRVGSNRGSGFGDSSNLSGVYEFGDDGMQDFWQSAASTDNSTAIPASGRYRTSTGGTGNVPTTARTNVGGCSTLLQLAFRGLRGPQVNGTWTLNIADAEPTDAGSVVGANSTLTLVTGPLSVIEAAMMRSGFEDGETPATQPLPLPVSASAVVGNCTPGVNTPTGSGLSDFVMVRSEVDDVVWSVKVNDTTATGALLPDFLFGRTSDYFLMGDFDGDGFSDPAIFRPGGTGQFQVRRSSRPNDVPLVVPLGTTGDEPDVIADFDGDRVTDFAVYRDGAPGDPTARFLIHRSSTSSISNFAIDNSDGSIPFALRDITGDGQADFGIQSSQGGVARFRVFSGHDGLQIGAPFDFGLPSDFVVPGHSVGSEVTDIAVSRNANPGTGTVKYFFPRDMETGAGDAGNLATGIIAGIPGDLITQGDYDGDGITDYAVWRPSATAGESKYLIRRSSQPATLFEVFHGLQGNYPVNNWDAH